MSYSGGVISKPVSTIDIGQALGVSSRDVGTLCTHNNINIWAKYKPQQVAQATPITDAQRLADKYGLTIPSASTPSGLEQYYDGDANGWTYRKPYSHFRMRDFDNYDAGAKAYVKNYITPSFLDLLDERAHTYEVMTSDLRYLTRAINLDAVADLFPLYYIGVAAYSFLGGSDCLVGTDPNTLDSATVWQNKRVTVNYYKPSGSGVGGSWKVVPFITSTPYTMQTWGAEPQGVFYPLPGADIRTINAGKRAPQVSITSPTVTKDESAGVLYGSCSLLGTVSGVSVKVTAWLWDMEVSGNPLQRSALPHEYKFYEQTVTLPTVLGMIVAGSISKADAGELWNNPALYLHIKQEGSALNARENLYGPYRVTV